eukprot:3179854-Rhodomonas_salina.4
MRPARSVPVSKKGWAGPGVACLTLSCLVWGAINGWERSTVLEPLTAACYCGQVFACTWLEQFLCQWDKTVPCPLSGPRADVEQHHARQDERVMT